MKKRFLTLYDKIILAALLGFLSLLGCARKSYPPQRQEQAESKTDSTKNADTLRIIKDNFDTRPVAMYGVRPTRNIK